MNRYRNRYQEGKNGIGTSTSNSHLQKPVTARRCRIMCMMPSCWRGSKWWHIRNLPQTSCSSYSGAFSVCWLLLRLWCRESEKVRTRVEGDVKKFAGRTRPRMLQINLLVIWAHHQTSSNGLIQSQCRAAANGSVTMDNCWLCVWERCHGSDTFRKLSPGMLWAHCQVESRWVEASASSSAALCVSQSPFTL